MHFGVGFALPSFSCYSHSKSQICFWATKITYKDKCDLKTSETWQEQVWNSCPQASQWDEKEVSKSSWNDFEEADQGNWQGGIKVRYYFFL